MEALSWLHGARQWCARCYESRPIFAVLVLSGLVALIGITRVPMAPKQLFLFDNVNLALALDHFNPRAHQPQPPGYPAFVTQARLLRAVFETPEHTFLVCSLLAAVLAPFVLILLGSRMRSR